MSSHGGLKNMVLELTKLEYRKKWQIPNNFRNSVLLLKISKIDGIGPFWPHPSIKKKKKNVWPLKLPNIRFLPPKLYKIFKRNIISPQTHHFSFMTLLNWFNYIYIYIYGPSFLKSQFHPRFQTLKNNDSIMFKMRFDSNLPMYTIDMAKRVRIF